MKRIHKYNLPINYTNGLIMPEGAVIISVQNQHEFPTIWAEVELGAPPQHRKLLWVPTGAQVPENKLYFHGTVQLNGGNLVFHLYELK